jgi:hypothetical protein
VVSVADGAVDAWPDAWLRLGCNCVRAARENDVRGGLVDRAGGGTKQSRAKEARRLRLLRSPRKWAELPKPSGIDM